MSTKSTAINGNPMDTASARTDNQAAQQNTIGHYVLGKALGEGTFGKVKLGTHILTGEKVAVKVLEKSRIKDKKDVERISREIKILKQLHHPNVVQIYEIIETEKDLYLVMEFVQKGELFDLIVQKQRLSEKQACRYFQELISGIAFIHQLGICHRDLKPENLLVDYDESLKIVDFGLSNLYEQGNTLKTACGSPCYAAPEMIAGNKYNGLMSDLWSCGVVLYAMLCGYLPYEDQKTADLYKKILNAEYNLPDFLSDDARDMIDKIFQTDPNKRINIEQIRVHPWYQLHKPETSSFNVCPPKIQAERSDIITKNGKQYQIIQRPNLLNQKIISNLETQQGFNRESLLKSIKNNKHNHLTATYYLLLKKHMIRQLRPYVDAFMELKLVEKESDYQVDTKNPSTSSKSQKPQITLQSQRVENALKNKEIKQIKEKNSETPIPCDKSNGSSQIGPIISGNKQFQSIDHNPNQIIGVQPKRQNFVENDYVDSSSIQQARSQQSRFSKRRNSNEGTEEKPQEFSNQTQQNFSKKTQQKNPNQFNQRREHSTNPYIGAPPNQKAHPNAEQYQNHLEQSKRESTRNNRFKNNNYNENENSNTELSSRNKNIKKKSQDSFKNVMNDENHPSINPNVNNQLINPYQVKKRAESYNNKRRGEKSNGNSLDQLDQFGIVIDETPQNIQYEVIQSKNMKQSQKGNHREVRAPSSGSSGSQPRVSVAGSTKESNGNHSNSSGVQRRYDSIEHQRQSQIDKFLKSPQDEIASLMNQKKQISSSDKYNKKVLTVSNKDNFRKNQIEGYQTQPNVNIVQQNTTNSGRARENISLVNFVKNKSSNVQVSQQLKQQQKNQRNSSKPQSITMAECDNMNSQSSNFNIKQQQVNIMNIQKKQVINSNHSQKSYKDQSGYQEHLDNSNFSNMDVKQQSNQQNSSKQVHRKAKSMLNSSGGGQNQNQNNEGQYQQNQKVQQIKLSDGSIRHLIQQLSTNNSSNNQANVQKINQNQIMGPGAPPTMPNAPKSGNILKLKQQVIRTKSNNQERPHNIKAQTITQQQQFKKKVHTTKNTNGQNFDITAQVHQQSVQHSSNTSKKQKSSITINSKISHVQKNTQPTPDHQMIANKEQYLKNLFLEYNNDQQQNSNNSIPLQMQVVGQNTQESVNKRSSATVQKLQGNKNVKPEKIQKQMTQNQKIMNNMTQNLMEKNLQKMEQGFNDSLRGSSKGIKDQSTVQNSQNQHQRRYSQHQGQNQQQIQHNQMRQQNYQKVPGGNHHNMRNQFLTQDNRNRGVNGSYADQKKDNGASEINSQQYRVKHPQSTTAAESGGYIENHAANNAMNAAFNAIGMDEVLGQIQAQMEFSTPANNSNNPNKQQRVQTAKIKGSSISRGERDSRDEFRNGGPDSRGEYRHSSKNIERGSRDYNMQGNQKQNYSSAQGKGGSTQMSIMSKYNQQQLLQQNQPNRYGPSGNQQPVRHYSAPREGVYGQNGIDDDGRDEIKRQHLLNQSVDMSQINNLQAQIKNLKSSFNNNYDEVQKLNLSQFGNNVNMPQKNQNPQSRMKNQKPQHGYNNSQGGQYIPQQNSEFTPKPNFQHHRNKTNFDFSQTQQNMQQPQDNQQKGDQRHQQRQMVQQYKHQTDYKNYTMGTDHPKDSQGQKESRSRDKASNNVIMGNFNLNIKMFI